MWIFMIIFWLLFIVGIVAIIKWFNDKTMYEVSALEILEKKYVRGEISKDNFDKIKEKITEMRS